MSAVVAEVGSSHSSKPLLDHYRCAEVPAFGLSGTLSKSSGFFRFGNDVVCYGQAVGKTSPAVNGHLFDASEHVDRDGNRICLPLDLTQTVDNLRYERYVNGSAGRRWMEKSWTKDVYYRLRPMFPISVRKHLQKIYLRDWDNIPFPNWPVDRSVDVLFERLLVLAMQALEIDRLPFIWFWPHGYKACAIMTHDVETRAGLDFCDRLMDIDDAFGIKASFQIVPEKRYAVPSAYLQAIRDRGFEVNVQGLDHDGNLFQNREAFLQSAAKINDYAEQYGSLGFRSPVLYRNIDWFRDLRFSYDMTVPNVARLEPQRGGCCTIMPYFLPGGMTELPVTMTEDYTLFHILQDYSTALWKRQMGVILQGYGLMNFIIHPDYVMSGRAHDVFKALMEEVGRQRADQKVWMPLPREVDRWWRDRSKMNLVANGQGWKIEGPGSDRARVAHVRLEAARLIYEIP